MSGKQQAGTADLKRHERATLLAAIAEMQNRVSELDAAAGLSTPIAALAGGGGNERRRVTGARINAGSQILVKFSDGLEFFLPIDVVDETGEPAEPAVVTLSDRGRDLLERLVLGPPEAASPTRSRDDDAMWEEFEEAVRIEDLETSNSARPNHARAATALKGLRRNSAITRSGE